ncbi:hypothetical protein ACE1BS_25255 [Aeromonas jandaei]
MTFMSVYDVFSKSHDGTDSYVELIAGLNHLLNVDKNHAAIYFTLHGFAHSYVQLYSDQPVEPDFARRAKLELQSYLDMALPVFIESCQEKNKWEILNEIIFNYQNSKKYF